jgi:MOSC domain-containing protein YiiM
MADAIRVESLNIGLPKDEEFHGRKVRTGMCKTPISEALQLWQLGFEGDGVADLKHHGGADKAACVYILDHYPYWQNILGADLPAAAFGENLSVSGMSEDDVCIGDIFRVGTAVVQVSQPRQPCSTLAVRYDRSDMVKLVVDSGRTGFYFKVLQNGVVRQGDTISLMASDPDRVSVTFANQIFHHDRQNREGIERVLAVPALSESWRQSFQKLKEDVGS